MRRSICPAAEKKKPLLGRPVPHAQTLFSCGGFDYSKPPFLYLSLQDLQHPQDTAHARIYDRLLEMCAPIRFSGENFRRATAQDKLAHLKNLMEPPALSPAADD